MKKLYRRILTVLLAFIICLNVNVYNPKADVSVSVSATSSVSIGGGATVTVSISGSDIIAYEMWISYDSSILQFNSGSGAVLNGGGGTVSVSGTSAGTITLSFTAIANGTAGIYTSGNFYDINGNSIPTSFGSASVTVSTPDTSGGGNSGSDNSGGGNSGGGNSGGGNSNQEVDNRSSNCYLSSLEVSHGTLDPEFAVDTYEYTLRVDEGVKEIAITAIPEDDEASTSVSGADDLEPGENIVEIIVTAENGAVKKYTINVIVGEILEDVIINIDGMDYTIINSSEGLQPPENFSQTTIKYDKWDVLAYKSPNGKLTLLCLSNEQNANKWFIYNDTTGEFLEYKEYSSKYNRYIILPFPENAVYPEGFVLTETIIFGSSVPAYQYTDVLDSDKYIIYGMNVDGEEGYYVFDMDEKTFMRYIMPEVATSSDADEVATVVDAEPEDKNGFLPDFLTTDIMFYIICGAAALLLILIICLIAFGCKIGKLNKELDKMEEELEEKTSATKEVKKLEVKETSSRKIEEVPLTEDGEIAASEEKDKTETQPIEDAVKEDTTEEAATEESDVENTENETTEENTESIEEKEETLVEDVEEKIEPVSEIPVVDFGLTDTDSFEEFEEQSKEINDIVNDENYDADKDSAF